jgi:hypothetical protein
MTAQIIKFPVKNHADLMRAYGEILVSIFIVQQALVKLLIDLVEIRNGLLFGQSQK